MEKKSTSWVWIIVWLIIFWPVGLFLVIKKLANDKSALMSGKTGVLSFVAWFLIVIGGMAFTGQFVSDTPRDNGGAAIVALGMFVGGILLLRKVSKTKKTATKYKKYIDIVVNQNVRSIDYVASSVGLPYDVVINDLQDMINIGYLKDAYIHQGNRKIAFKQPEPAVYTQTATIGQAPAQTVATRCPGCGANNVVSVGRVSECEYCGTPINA
ncbi:MAG: hypothetical protein LBQ42_04890 [Synergistaceae bacterium]|jgi:hypothetical protein|nr:hypothetical protein [Synergistaceae bacterium]